VRASASIISDVLEDEGLWAEFGCKAALEVLAERALTYFNISEFRLDRNWRYIDDRAFRKRIATPESLEPIFTDLVLNDRTLFDAAISSNTNLGRLSNRSFRASVRSAFDNLTHKQGVVQFVETSPFPRILHRLAELVAAELVEDLNPINAPEWKVLRYSTLANFLRYCQLTTANDFWVQFQSWRQKPLALRGHCFHLSHRVSKSGFEDSALKIRSPIPPANFTGNQGDSFVRQVGDLYENLLDGGSAFVDEIGAGEPRPEIVEEAHRRGVAPDEVQSHRRESFIRYEWYCLAFLASSTIERVLRGYAKKLSINHISNDGVPSSIVNWIGNLSLPSHVEEAVLDLYSREGTNLRNMLMHAALNGIEGIRQELIVSSRRARAETKLHRKSPSSPRNIALHLIEVASLVNQNCPAITPNDLTWVSHFGLASDEVVFLNTLHSEILNPDGDVELGLKWYHYVRQYVDAIAPGLHQFFNIGGYYWIGESRPDSPLAFSLLTLLFEGLLRTTVHLTGDPVLQRSLKGGVFSVGYRMLGTRNRDLVNDDTIANFLADAKRTSHPNIRRVLQNAIRLRNACAHGAFPNLNLSNNNHRVFGHAYIKSCQLLTGVSITHMQEEAAFYRWKRARLGKHGYDVDDWYWAERRVIQRIQEWAN
jgi:hypothetical protein